MVLLHVFFNQMVHFLVKEALHILAPTLSLRNTTIIVLNGYSKDSFPKEYYTFYFQQYVTLLKEILQQVLLRFYTSFRKHSTASIQGLFLKLKHVPSTNASIEFY